MIRAIYFIGFISLCVCDVSLRVKVPYYPPPESKPYPANAPLPGEYGAPPIVKTPTSFQVSKENLRFAGQTVEITSQTPYHAYLAPNPSNQFQKLQVTKVCIIAELYMKITLCNNRLNLFSFNRHRLHHFSQRKIQRNHFVHN